MIFQSYTTCNHYNYIQSVQNMTMARILSLEEVIAYRLEKIQDDLMELKKLFNDKTNQTSDMLLKDYVGEGKSPEYKG